MPNSTTEPTQTKACTKCGIAKPATSEFFGSHNQCKDGLRPDCKVCKSTRDSEYRRTHLDERRESRRKWAKENPDKIKASGQRYWRKNHWSDRNLRRIYEPSQTEPTHILLTKGYSTVVDPEDADLASFLWSATKRDHGNTAYAFRMHRDPKSKEWIHRTILSRVLGRPLLTNEQVDHIDGNGLNNQRTNLRLATHANNIQNRGLSKHNTSGYKGVSWNKRQKKWTASISSNGKAKFLGRFNTPQEAYKAYCNAARELHGEFANFGNSKEYE